MSSHYAVLGISQDATFGDVRAAYRRQVKAVHPDLNQGTPDSVERMKRLVQAWEVLSDPERRHEYDLRHGFRRTRSTDPEPFDYADFLRSRRTDPAAQSKLIFYDLLHDNPDEALRIYDALCSVEDYEMSRYLGREDFMDCAFLLAEEYEARQDYLKAFELYSAIVRFERYRPYFRHFMTDVYERLRDVVCFRMGKVEDTDTVLSCLHQMTGWDIPRKEAAFIHRTAAEIHLEKGDRRAAHRSLQRGLALNPRLAGVKKLQQELGLLQTAR